jgi:hypothetical protein
MRNFLTVLSSSVFLQFLLFLIFCFFLSSPFLRSFLYVCPFSFHRVLLLFSSSTPRHALFLHLLLTIFLPLLFCPFSKLFSPISYFCRLPSFGLFLLRLIFSTIILPFSSLLSISYFSDLSLLFRSFIPLVPLLLLLLCLFLLFISAHPILLLSSSSSRPTSSPSMATPKPLTEHVGSAGNASGKNSEGARSKFQPVHRLY